MVRVVNISEAHVHLHYSVRRFRDHLVKHIEKESNKLVLVCFNILYIFDYKKLFLLLLIF